MYENLCEKHNITVKQIEEVKKQINFGRILSKLCECDKIEVKVIVAFADLVCHGDIKPQKE